MCSSVDEFAAKYHSGNSLRVRDIAEGISVQDQEVSRFARLNRTVLVELTHELCRPDRGRLDGRQRSQPRLHEQRQLTVQLRASLGKRSVGACHDLHPSPPHGRDHLKLFLLDILTGFPVFGAQVLPIPETSNCSQVGTCQVSFSRKRSNNAAALPSL